MDLYNLFATHLVKLDKSIRYGLIQLVHNTPGKTGPEYISGMDLYNLFATHLVKLDKSIRYGLIQLVRNTPGKTGQEYQVWTYTTCSQHTW